MNKQVVGTSVAKSTKTTTEADGTIVETITTTTTEKYSDGSSGTKTKVETNKKSGGGGGGGTGGGGSMGAPAPMDPATSTAPKTNNTTDPKWIQDCLAHHNTMRAKHGAPALTLNDELAKIAQAWANNLAKIGKMQHSTAGFGENVYWNTEAVDPKRPVDQWYSEIKDYNFSNMEGQKGTGHFTQLIWKATTEVGIALAPGSNGNFIVAEYNPPGNFVGKYAENIQK